MSTELSESRIITEGAENAERIFPHLTYRSKESGLKIPPTTHPKSLHFKPFCYIM